MKANRRLPGRLITIGSFDGIHRGHAALLQKTILEAKNRKVKSLALTFDVPPRMVLNNETTLALLTTSSEKEKLLKSFGIDDIVFLPFKDEISKLSAFSFFKKILIERFKAKGIVVGIDFRFGENRGAGAHELVKWGQEFEIPVWVLPQIKWQRQVVSSSLIRTFFDQNKWAKVSQYLGHPYSIEGNIIKGRGVGRQIGFPTFNLKPGVGKLLPRGVFIVKVTSSQSEKSFFGVCNIGVRPTFSGPKTTSIEVHILGDDLPYRPKQVNLEILKFVRSEKKFKNLKQLVSQIRKDVAKSRRFIKKFSSC